MNFSNMLPIVVKDVLKILGSIEDSSDGDSGEKITRIRSIIYLLGARHGVVLSLVNDFLKEIEDEKIVLSSRADDIAGQLRNLLAGAQERRR